MTHTAEITVLILDDYPLFTLGVFVALYQTRYEIVGLEDRQDIRGSMEKLRPDIVLLGAELENLTDPVFIEGIARKPKPSLIFVTEAPVTFSTLKRRVRSVRGLLHRRATGQELLECLDTVSRGDVYVTPSLVPRNPRKTQEEIAARHHVGLTWRESEVIKLVQLGFSNSEIGIKLDIKTSTVVSHVKRIRRKLGVKNRTQAVVAFLHYETTVKTKSFVS